jgi:hypothetical protein
MVFARIVCLCLGGGLHPHVEANATSHQYLLGVFKSDAR